LTTPGIPGEILTKGIREPWFISHKSLGSYHQRLKAFEEGLEVEAISWV
jgi:hypothetical protein